MWKKDLKISFNETFLSFVDNQIRLIGKTIFEFENLDNFYKSFQVKRNNRKKIKKIELDFIYNVDNKTFDFDNIKVDGNENENFKKYIDDFNLSGNRIFNKITFKNFVSNFFNSYSG